MYCTQSHSNAESTFLFLVRRESLARTRDCRRIASIPKLYSFRADEIVHLAFLSFRQFRFEICRFCVLAKAPSIPLAPLQDNCPVRANPVA